VRNTPILLIEDNAADITLIRSALQRRGLTGDVTVIRDGEKAIQYASDLDACPDRPLPGLVIMDLNLPKVDGRDVLRRFHSSLLARVPVVILSSSDAERDRQATAELGAKRYIKKPMNLPEFMEIGRLIENVLTGTTG